MEYVHQYKIIWGSLPRRQQMELEADVELCKFQCINLGVWHL